MTTISADAMPRALADPQTYPSTPISIELIETHISWVAIADEEVYKCKKPVRFDFLDFSTLQLRKQACEEEVRLNRRLAAEIYLGIVPVTRQDDGLRIGGAGTPVEWLVHMRRLPREQTLDQLLLQQSLSPEEIDRLAEKLVAFYRELPPAQVGAATYLANYVNHVQQNRRELLAAAHQLPGDLVKRIHAFQLQLLHLQPELFNARVAAAKIVEGHGDLRPEHICLSDPLVVFDCIEFSRELRTLDMADELAFLAAECDHLGAGWVGPRLFAEYERLSGDRPAPLLLNFYKSYRACVRGKIAALRGDQLAGPQQEAAIGEALHYLQQADAYRAIGDRPLVLAVGGLSGTGKSTVARALAERLGADLLRTDVIRTELFGPRPRSGIDAGIYQPRSRERVYAAMFEQAAELLRRGLCVILDGTFNSAAALLNARQLANDHNARFLAIACTCPPEVARQRIEQRLQANNDASQADLQVFESQQAAWQAWPADMASCEIITTEPLTDQLLSAQRAIAALPPVLNLE